MNFSLIHGNCSPGSSYTRNLATITITLASFLKTIVQAIALWSSDWGDDGNFRRPFFITLLNIYVAEIYFLKKGRETLRVGRGEWDREGGERGGARRKGLTTQISEVYSN